MAQRTTPTTSPATSVEEALQKSIAWFGGDELAASVYVSKYALTDPETGLCLEPTPDLMHRRLAREFARIEAKYPNPLSEDQIFDHLRGFKEIIPQGSPMSAIGNPFRVESISNCFVIPVGDSYGWICQADQQLAQIYKRRGGCGLDISAIRPKNFATKNAARTSDGIAGFMERFSNTTREVAQNSRRGANMQTISVHHPEVLTFIKIKRDKKKVTGSNISVRLSDEFMRAVVEDRDYEQRFPVEGNPRFSQMVSAKEVWNEIIYSAWFSAEPGLLFWDRVQNYSPVASYGLKWRNSSTNPCQPGWAPLLTRDGIRPMTQIQIGTEVWSGSQWTKVVNKVCTGVKPVYEYRTRAGTFYGTENHRVFSRGERVEVQDAETIDTTQGPVPEKSPLDPRDVMNGLVWGDGTYHKASRRTFLIIGKDDECYHQSEVKDLLLEHRPGVKAGYWAVESRFNGPLPNLPERSLDPAWIESLTPTQIRGFLRGVYSANGSVVANRVTLKATSFKFVEQVQMFLSALGIRSYYTTNKAHDVEFSNGVYECRESYDLNIGYREGRKRFQDLIGFIHPEKQERLTRTFDTGPASRDCKRSYEVVERVFVGEEPVYDITVEAPEHSYWTNGLLVSNCSELPLADYDACRLLLVNLTGFVQDRFLPGARFDHQEFGRVVQVAQRLMDDIVDLELEAIDKILAKVSSDPEPDFVKEVERSLWTKVREKCSDGRRTGLGITGLGDTIAYLGVKYGSQESINLTEEIYKTLCYNSYLSSHILAGERGSFPDFDAEKEQGNEFLEHLWEAFPDLRELNKTCGRRNIANLTTAPAGSVSIETQTSSGIESVFRLEYLRRRKKAGNDTLNVDFVDANGDRWQNYTVYHHGLQSWKDVTGETDITKSPYWGATSEAISWESSVELQGVAQRWIDHAISKTCNLPSTATQEDVASVYLAAWKAGCKGFTVYRDKCRDGVLVTEEEKKVEPTTFSDHHAPKRPIELPCEIHQVQVQGEKWSVFVGLLDGKPYEVIGGLANLVKIPRKVKTGRIVKHNGVENPKARYDLHYGEDLDDETVIQDVAGIWENPTHAAFTRTISLALRHGTPVQYVVEQLTKGSEKEDDMFSFSRCISRVLKGYIQDGTSTKKTCPTCKNQDLIYQEGCVSCPGCGWSKCS